MTSVLVHTPPSLLGIVDHSGRRRLGIVEGVWAGCHHSAHVGHARHEALVAWVGRESRYGGQLGSVVIVNHAVHFLGNQIRCRGRLPIRLRGGGGGGIALGGLRITSGLAGGDVAAIRLAVIVSLLLGLHHLVRLIIEALLLLLRLISVGLERGGVDGAFGDLGEWCARPALRSIRRVSCVGLMRESVGHLERVLLVEGLLVRLRCV